MFNCASGVWSAGALISCHSGFSCSQHELGIHNAVNVQQPLCIEARILDKLESKISTLIFNAFGLAALRFPMCLTVST